ncbi:MAG: hypothetical protein J6K32_01100 [Clostridia bacterium]|nr:hypothetical protein [Clostridia bacterium]
MKKNISLMLALLLMLFTACAAAQTFEEGAELVLGYMEDTLKLNGITYHFTECDEARNAKFSKALGFSYFAKTNQSGNTFCTLKGHNEQLEVFTAETSDLNHYNDMIWSALTVVQGLHGRLDDDLMLWVDQAAGEIHANADSGEDIAFMYPMEKGRFFYLEMWHETNYTAKPHFSASVAFPCEKACVMTKTVENMKKAAKAVPQTAEGKVCHDCSGTGYVTVKNVDCRACNGTGEKLCMTCRGDTICGVCDGSGSIEKYNYVMEFSTFITCGACGGRGVCRACSGKVYVDCEMCMGLGRSTGKAKCAACGGDGAL